MFLFAAEVREQRTAEAAGLQEQPCSDPSAGTESGADGGAFAVGLKYCSLGAECLNPLG